MPLGLWVILMIPVYAWLWLLSFRWLTELDTYDKHLGAPGFIGAFFMATIGCWLFGPVAILTNVSAWLSPRLHWEEWARAIGGENRRMRADRHRREALKRAKHIEKAEREVEL